MESKRQIRIGTAGWSYKDWDGIFYPPELRSRKLHPLEYLPRFFDVVEINTSFYGHIKPELARLWSRKVAAVNPNFVFTAKLHRSFTQRGRSPSPRRPGCDGYRREVGRSADSISGFI